MKQKIETDSEDYRDFAKAKYSITELSDMLDMHPQSIRFFEKEGLIDPERSASNGRRRYSVYDAYTLQLRKNYEELGFSLRQTVEVLKKDSIDDITNEFSQVTNRLKERIKRKSYLVQGLEAQQEALGHLKYLLHKPSLRIRPAAWRHSHIVGTEICLDKASKEARLKAITLMPLARYSIRIDKNERESGHGCKYYCDVTVPEEAAKEYGFDQIPGSYYVPSQTCLYSIIKLPALEVPDLCHHPVTFSIMKDQMLKVSGDIFCDLLVNCVENGEKVQYYESWFPVVHVP